LIAQARQAVDGLSLYQVRLRRRERVGETLQPQEEVLLSIRRQPRAVRIEWPDGPSKGREVLYAAGEGPEVMHVKSPGALVPRVTLAVDSPLVLKNSRHPITEAGLEAIVATMEQWWREEPDRIVHQGRQTAPSMSQASDKIVFTSADGETRVVYLDPATHLPVLVEVTASNGDLLEFYQFRDLRRDCPELSSPEAFDPDHRWGEPQGLLSRITKAAAPANSEPSQQP
jgi:hypothetical protein